MVPEAGGSAVCRVHRDVIFGVGKPQAGTLEYSRRVPRPRPLRLIPLIHQVTHRIGLHVANWRTPELTQAEAHILDSLTVSGPCTVGTLHDAFAHRRSTLTSVLDRLERRKLITRRASEHDRRFWTVGLTPAGARLGRRVHARFEALEARALAGAAEEDLAAVRRLLDRVAGASSAAERRRDPGRSSRRALRR